MLVLLLLGLLPLCMSCGEEITVGTWNAMRQPWLPEWEDQVNKNVAQKDIDVLHLVEIWTDEEALKILARKDVAALYPYHYRAQKRNTETCGCGNNPYFTTLGTEFLNCLIRTGTNPREIIQPSNGRIADECFTFGVQMVLLNPANTTDGFLCLACIINSAQKYVPGQFGVSEIIAQCNAGKGPLYAYGGESGHLILSKCPLEDVQEEPAYAWLSNRVNIYATFQGVTIGFGHFAYNFIEDINPLYASLMFGQTQVQQATQMILRDPDLIVGDLNTGSNYQPAGYNLLMQHYDTTFSTETDTYCPSNRGSFKMCIGAAPQAIDHILVRKCSGVQYELAKLFNTKLISDHVGVKAVVYAEE